MEINHANKLLVIGAKPENLTTLRSVVGAALPQAIILTAVNGPAGLDIVANEDPNVILIDIVLPGLDGVELCRRLKADARTCDIPVVFLMPREIGANSRANALEAGAEGFLSKPLEAIELTAQIRVMTKIREFNRSRRMEMVRPEALALRESEARYRLLFDHSPDGIVVANPDLYFIDVNSSICRMLGYSRDELIGMHASKIVVAEETRSINSDLHNEVTTRSDFFHEWTFRRKDGSTFRAEVFAATLPDGNPVEIIRDISDHKRAKEQLIESFATLNDIMESASTPYFSLDRTYCYTSFNSVHAAVMKALYGTTIKIGENMLAYQTNLEDRETARRNIDRALAGEQFTESAFSGESDRTRRYFEIAHNPIRDPDGNVIGVSVFSSDITERKIAEQALKASEQFSKDTLNSLSASIAILDEHGVILAVNQSWQNFALENGADPAAVSTGINYLRVCDLATGDDSEGGSSVADGIRAVIQGKQDLYSIEYPCHSPDTHRWFVARVTRFSGEGPLRIVVAHENITERKLVAEALRESEEYLSATLRSIGDAVIACDAEGHVTRLNLVAEALTGWTNDEAVGKPIQDVFHIVNARTREVAENPIFRSLRQGVIVGLANHTALIARSGMEYQIADTCAPIRDVSGIIKGAVLVFRDVTGEYRKREELREAEERLRFALEKSHTGGFILNLVDQSAYRTSEHARIFGYDSNLSPWTSEIFLDHIVPEERNAVARLLQHSISTGEDLYFECRIRRTDGALRWIRANAGHILDAEGRYHRMAGIIQDITESKVAEAALTEKTYLLSESQRIAHIGSYIWDIGPGSIQWSDECYRLYGVSRDTFVMTAEAGIALIHPEDQSIAQEWARAIVAGEEPYPVTYRSVWPDGSVHWLVTDGELDRDADSKPIRMIGTSQDITERKRVEEDLEKSVMRFQIAQEMSPDGFTILHPVLDDKGEIVDFSWIFENSSIAQINGTDPQKVIGQRLLDLFPGHRGTPVFNAYLNVAKTGELKVIEEISVGNILSKPMWLRLVIVSMGDDIAILTQNITARKQAEEKLRESEALFSTVFQSNPIGINIFRAPDNRSVDVNEAFLNIIGYSREEVVGYSAAELNLFIDSEARNAWMKTLRAGGHIYNQDAKIRSKSGAIKDVMASLNMIQINGEPMVLVIASDVTERKRAEENVIDAKRRLESILNGTNAGTWEWNVQTGQTIFNERWADIIGYTLGELSPLTIQNWANFCHPDDLEKSNRLLKDCFEGRTEYYECECRMKHKNGSWVWVIDRGKVATYTMDGQPEWMFGTHMDITERVRAQESLRQSEAFFRAVMDNLPVGIAVNSVDPTVVFNYMNDNFPVFYRTTREALAVPDNFWNAVYEEPTFREEMKKRILDGIATGDPERMRWENIPIPRKGEETRYISAHNVHLPDKTLMISTVWDITERIIAEQERQKFFLLAESSSEFIGMCDLELQPLYVNPAGQRMVGLPDLEAACRVRVPDYFFPEDQAFIEDEFFPRVLRDGQGDVEIRLRHFQTGEPIWVYYYLFSVHEAGGKAIGWATVSRDITEKRRIEAEIRTLNAELEQRVLDRTAQLAAANKELEAFSYSVSHDLRAPLRGVDGYSRILEEDYAPKLDAEARRVISIIRGEAQRMGQLIDDLLAFSRLGRQSIHVAEVDLHALAQEAFTLCAAQEPDRKIEFKLHPLPPARGDTAMLRQVLVNLLSNAVKYTRKREVAHVEVGVLEHGEMDSPAAEYPSTVTYFIRDDGAGFDMKYAGKLFGVFQRLHSLEEFEGTGVGLALVQRIIHRHGGRIWAEGKVNAGATFYFTFE